MILSRYGRGEMLTEPITAYVRERPLPVIPIVVPPASTQPPVDNTLYIAPELIDGRGYVPDTYVPYEPEPVSFFQRFKLPILIGVGALGLTVVTVVLLRR